MKITIYGIPGTGTTTIGQNIAKALNYKFVSNGNKIREIAKNQNLTLNELIKEMKKDNKIDLEIDQYTKNFGKQNNNFIYESRTAFYFIPDSFKIALICDQNERYRRIAKRENKDLKLVKKETQEREENEIEKFNKLYQLKLDQLDLKKNFDLIIDTTNKTIDEISQKIITEIKTKNKEKELNKLKKELLNNLKCPLRDNATNLVFGDTNPNAKIMIIGEAPGKNEDLTGKPFVGNAGQKLDELLKIINLNRKEIYIANILKYRPPKNRNPTEEEILRHTPYLIKQIKIIDPKIIITLGNYATKFILGGFKIETMNKVPGITQIHGKPKKIKFQKSNNSFLIFPTYHPAATIYNPNLVEEIKKDFQKLNKIIKNKLYEKEK